VFKIRVLLPLALLLGCCLPAAANATVPVSAVLHTSFTPDRLGVSTTIGFSFELSSPGGVAPPPLRTIDLHMPAGMNYTKTTLGLAVCQPKALEEEGSAACPNNSRLGSGEAFVEVPFGTGNGKELPTIEAFMGPAKKGNLVVLFYVNGREPVSAQLLFTGELLPASGIFGSQLNTTIPLIRSVPGGPYVSIVRVEAQLGPRHLLYTKRVHGKVVRFHPRGISIPTRCPKQGFPLSADFGFDDGSHTSALSTIPCPKR
jgi:hypothetical protein